MSKGSLGRQLVANMERITIDRIGDSGVANAKRNRAFMDRGQSLAALRNKPLGRGDSAVIIAAGPSIKRFDPINEIKRSGYDGAIICTESALYYCLRNGVVPDLTVTLDPHATRIVRWFGDRHLTEVEIGKDDYYRRQDMDEAFARELETNREILALLDEYGPQINIALASSASKAVVDRVLETGMNVYWWNPMYDDPDQPDSVTRALQKENRLPAVNAGGNVGTACWMMAHAVLGKSRIALTGMDFSYYGDTPYSQTQYYKEAVDLVGVENLDTIYMTVDNPFTGTSFYTDPAYMWYKESFISLVKESEDECITYNCTGGGILFEDPIRWIALEDFLKISAV